MDIGATISRAVNIVFKHRVLWVLGFLAALAGGGSGGGTNFTLPSPGTGGFPIPGGPSALENFNANAVLAGLAGLGCVLLLIGIVLWVVGLIARGGLIGAVQQIETAGNTSFGTAWRVGASKFWPILGLNVLLILPIALIVILAVVLFGGAIAAIIVGASQADDGGAGIAGGVFGLLCFGGVLACVGVIVGIVIMALQTFGERAIVLENRGVLESFGRSWEIVRANLGNVILLAVLMFIISLVVGLIVGVISAALFLPVVLTAIGEAGGQGVGTGTIALGALSFLAVVIVSAIVGAIFIAFNSTTWTLAYRQFSGMGSASAAAPAAPLPTV
jgi:hypothetical protein